MVWLLPYGSVDSEGPQLPSPPACIHENVPSLVALARYIPFGDGGGAFQKASPTAKTWGGRVNRVAGMVALGIAALTLGVACGTTHDGDGRSQTPSSATSAMQAPPPALTSESGSATVAAAGPVVLDCRGQAERKPAEIVFFCADANGLVKDSAAATACAIVAISRCWTRLPRSRVLLIHITTCHTTCPRQCVPLCVSGHVIPQV
jgi:hypothetical protein